MRTATVRIGMLLGAALLSGAACATRGGEQGGERTRCELKATDSLFASTGPVYRDCAVDRKARLINSTQIRPEPVNITPGCQSVQIEFVVGIDGTPEVGTVRTVRATSSAFASSVIETLSLWKYEPALIDGIPVRQIVNTERKMSIVVVAAGSPGPPRSPVC